MVSRALRELEDEGLVRREGREIIITDRAALERRFQISNDQSRT